MCQLTAVLASKCHVLSQLEIQVAHLMAGFHRTSVAWARVGVAHLKGKWCKIPISVLPHLILLKRAGIVLSLPGGSTPLGHTSGRRQVLKCHFFSSPGIGCGCSKIPLLWFLWSWVGSLWFIMGLQNGQEKWIKKREHLLSEGSSNQHVDDHSSYFLEGRS